MQTLEVEVLPVKEEWKGCAASPHPRSQVVNTQVKRQFADRSAMGLTPIQIPKSKQGPAKPVFHPQRDMNLQEISCDEEVVKRCGMQIFRIVDKNTKLLVSHRKTHRTGYQMR